MRVNFIKVACAFIRGWLIRMIRSLVLRSHSLKRRLAFEPYSNPNKQVGYEVYVVSTYIRYKKLHTINNRREEGVVVGSRRFVMPMHVETPALRSLPIRAAPVRPRPLQLRPCEFEWLTVVLPKARLHSCPLGTWMTLLPEVRLHLLHSCPDHLPLSILHNRWD
jgi:hypothetical protein